jgi:hypothetical protein
MFSMTETPYSPLKAEKMREKHDPDRELFDAIYQTMTFPINPNNPLFAELETIDRLLDETPEILALVAADLNRRVDAVALVALPPTGRRDRCQPALS